MEYYPGQFLLDAKYDGVESLFVNIECAPPLQYMAKRITEEHGDAVGMILAPDLLSIPSIEHLKGFDNLKENIFFLIYQAIITTKLNGFSADRLHTGFSVVEGQIKNIINVPESEGIHALENILIERVQQNEADWAASFSFARNEGEEGMLLDLVNPRTGYSFFIPIECDFLENKDIFFKVCVQQTRLVAHGGA